MSAPKQEYEMYGRPCRHEDLPCRHCGRSLLVHTYRESLGREYVHLWEPDEAQYRRKATKYRRKVKR